MHPSLFPFLNPAVQQLMVPQGAAQGSMGACAPIGDYGQNCDGVFIPKRHSPCGPDSEVCGSSSPGDPPICCDIGSPQALAYQAQQQSRIRPKRPILRAQLAAANPPLPAPQFRLPVRYAPPADLGLTGQTSQPQPLKVGDCFQWGNSNDTCCAVACDSSGGDVACSVLCIAFPPPDGVAVVKGLSFVSAAEVSRRPKLATNDPRRQASAAAAATWLARGGRQQLAAQNPPQYYPHFRAQRRADAPMTMYVLSSNGTKTPIDPNSPQGLQLAAEVRRRKGAGPATLCLPMPTPSDPGAQVCAFLWPGLDPPHAPFGP